MSPTRPLISLSVLVLITAIPLSGGCKPKKYAVSTRIDANGEFDRDTLQPLDDSLPREALANRKPNPPSSQPADYILNPAWQKEWRQCTTQPGDPDTEGTYVAARGHFAVADEIPQNYHLIAYPYPSRASSNQISHAFEDCLLFGIDSWSETLTEVITLSDYVDAVDDMLRKTVPAVNAALDDVLGQEYEMAALRQYLDEDLRSTVRRLYLWCYDNGPGINAEGLSGAPVRELKSILSGAHFLLPLTDGAETVDQDRLSAAWEPFFRERLRTLLRVKPSKQELNDEQATALMRRFGLFNDAKPATASQPAEQLETKDLEALRLAFLRHFERLNKMPYDQSVLQWESRIGGAHRINPLMHVSLHEQTGSRHFSYSFAAGGPILETNGPRVAEDQVRWEFTDLDIWPRGYPMQVTAVRWNREAEKRLFGKVVLRDLDTVLHLRDLIADHDEIYDALAQAIEQGDLHPIKVLSESKEPANREAAKTILGLKPKK